MKSTSPRSVDPRSSHNMVLSHAKDGRPVARHIGERIGDENVTRIMEASHKNKGGAAEQIEGRRVERRWLHRLMERD